METQKNETEKKIKILPYIKEMPNVVLDISPKKRFITVKRKVKRKKVETTPPVEKQIANEIITPEQNKKMEREQKKYRKKWNGKR